MRNSDVMKYLRLLKIGLHTQAVHPCRAMDCNYLLWDSNCTIYHASIDLYGPAPPGVTSERRLEGLCIHFLICCLLSVCNVFTTPRAGHQSSGTQLVLYNIYIELYRTKLHFTVSYSIVSPGLGS